MSQPHAEGALQDFLRWESQSLVEVVADIATDQRAYFMPVDTLKSYFKANGSKKLIKILSDEFKSEDIPMNPEVILRGHTAVFSILLHLLKGRHIEYFARFEELSDQRLPIDPTHPPACFPEATDDPLFLQRFCEKQWMYCVPIFDNYMLHKHFGRQRLLPITYQETLGGGGGALIYKIKLYEPLNKLLPAGSQTKMNNTDPNTFILKRYTKEAEDRYKQEVSGYWNLKHPESIIGFYGNYTHGDDYNILLEFADKGSLEAYFQTETPPSRGEDIIKFWESLFQLIKALKSIHSILGWHQHVKPDNVLVLSYGSQSAFDWQFKLANFGRSHFTSKVSTKGDTMSNDSLGDQTYGAPECYNNLDDQMGRSLKIVTQAVDIWSLGCIYSMAAMWIADGYKGIADYRKQRMAEIDKIPNFKGGDCFHDGERVLQVVMDAHKDVEQRLRRSDYITKDVLGSMVEEMLWEEDRPGAKALSRKAEGILSRARQRLASHAAEDLPVRSDSNSRYLSHPLPQGIQSPPTPPPQRPLPPRPRVQPPTSIFAERQYPASVETWRSQVSGPSTDLASSVYGGERRRSPESVSEVPSSVASWQGGSNGSLASPLTSTFSSPVSSPQLSFRNDLNRQSTNEVQPRPLQYQRSSSQRKPIESSYVQSNMNISRLPDDPHVQTQMNTSILPVDAHVQLRLNLPRLPENPNVQPHLNASRLPDNSHVQSHLNASRLPDSSPVQTHMSTSRLPDSSHVQSYVNTSRLPDNGLMTRNMPEVRPHPEVHAEFSKEVITMSPTEGHVEDVSAVDDAKTIGGVSVQSSSVYSLPMTSPAIQSESPSYPSSPESFQILPKSQKKLREFTLFPQRMRTNSGPPPAHAAKAAHTHTSPMSRFGSFSSKSASPVSTFQADRSHSAEYLSLATALDWKQAHKKVKKASQAPLLPGAIMLDKLKDRDHVFIIDDGVSMREQWPGIKSVFEALSYILKPMSPDGIELFFTVAYDTWRRHNTTELQGFLDKKGVEGDTNISYRLGLQLQGYTAKILPPPRKGSSKAKKVRPMSVYVLTDGKWKAGGDPKATIKATADHLISTEHKDGQVTIQFISFGQDTEGLQRINDVAKTDFGLDLVDTTPWTDNVLKMLLGPLDRKLSQGSSTIRPTTASTVSTWALPPPASYISELA